MQHDVGKNMGAYFYRLFIFLNFYEIFVILVIGLLFPCVFKAFLVKLESYYGWESIRINLGIFWLAKYVLWSL